MSKENQAQFVMAIVDMSGSMRGQAIATAQTQIQEMYSDLQTGDDNSFSSIWFGVYGLKENADWIMEPKNINSVTNLPTLKISAGTDGLYPRVNYIKMCQELVQILNNIDRQFVKEIHLILFTDGFATEKEEVLKKAINTLKRDAVFSHYCIRYVIKERLDSSNEAMDYAKWFFDEFASEKSNVVDADGYSGLLSKIQATLPFAEKQQKGPHSVF